MIPRCPGAGTFVQRFEGSPAAVRTLWRRLQSDPNPHRCQWIQSFHTSPWLPSKNKTVEVRLGVRFCKVFFDSSDNGWGSRDTPLAAKIQKVLVHPLAAQIQKVLVRPLNGVVRSGRKKIHSRLFRPATQQSPIRTHKYPISAHILCSRVMCRVLTGMYSVHFAAWRRRGPGRADGTHRSSRSTSPPATPRLAGRRAV